MLQLGQEMLLQDLISVNLEHIDPLKLIADGPIASMQQEECH